MTYQNALGAFVWAAILLAVLLAIGLGSTTNELTEKRLTVLSLAASMMALIFTPLTRALPDALSIVVFMFGFWLVLGTISFALIGSLIKFIQTRRKLHFINLILSTLAVGLFYINSTTSLFWPYKT